MAAKRGLEMYIPKKDQPCYYSLKFVHYFHYYPWDKQTENMALYRAMSVILRILTSFVCIECGIHLFMSVKDKVPVETTVDLVALTGIANCMVVCILFETAREMWSQFFQDLGNMDERFGTPPKMPVVLQKNKRYTILYTAFCVSGCFIYTLSSVTLDKDRCMKINVEKGIHEICGVIFPIWWPYNEIGSYTRWFVVAYQFFCIVYYNLPAAAFTLITWECAQVIAAKIHHLKDLFVDAFSIDDPNLRKKRLAFCIRYHQELIRVTTNFSKIIKRVFGHCSFALAIILSWIGVECRYANSIGPFLHLVGYSVGIYLICEAGQIIQDETYDVQDAVYESEWYTDLKLAKDIVFVLVRSQKPIYLETTPLGCLSYSVLITVIQTAYSYMTLISNTTKRD